MAPEEDSSLEVLIIPPEQIEDAEEQSVGAINLPLPEGEDPNTLRGRFWMLTQLLRDPSESFGVKSSKLAERIKKAEALAIRLGCLDKSAELREALVEGGHGKWVTRSGEQYVSVTVGTLTRFYV